MNKDRCSLIRDKFREFVVAGTAGAFLSILFLNLPRDLRGTSLSPYWPYTVDLFVRYGYLMWMMLYFFISAYITYITRKDKEHPNRVLVFGIAQSISALCSQYWLGFVQIGEPGGGRPGYLMANIAIVLISSLSLLCFASYDNPRMPGGLNWVSTNGLRAFTLVISAASLGLAWLSHESPCLSWIMAASESILWLNLFAYIAIRLKWSPE